QAEDGIRDFHVTGVQTCALPIYGLTQSDLGQVQECALVQEFHAADRPNGQRARDAPATASTSAWPWASRRAAVEAGSNAKPPGPGAQAPRVPKAHDRQTGCCRNAAALHATNRIAVELLLYLAGSHDRPQTSPALLRACSQALRA